MPQSPWTISEGYYERADGSVVHVTGSQQMQANRIRSATNTSTDCQVEESVAPRANETEQNG
jgi:hypothetical protein